MTRSLGVIALMLALLAAFGVYALKDRVLQVETELRRVQAAIRVERTALGRLRTEWAMLNQPGRLARLAQTHLDLVPAHPGQITRIADLPLHAEIAQARLQWPALLPSGAEAVLRLKPHRWQGSALWPATGARQTTDSQ
jgi:cell division protein FtsL